MLFREPSVLAIIPSSAAAARSVPFSGFEEGAETFPSYVPISPPLPFMVNIFPGRLPQAAPEKYVRISSFVSVLLPREPMIFSSCTRPPVDSFVISMSSAAPMLSLFADSKASSSFSVSVRFHVLSPYSSTTSGTARRYATLLLHTFSLFSV